MMKLIKTVIIFLLSLSFLGGCGSSILAQTTDTKQVVLVNPIRGKDFWESKDNILNTPQKQYELIKKNNFSSTWLIRYDALTDPEVINFLKTLDSKQDIGLFFEITPTFARDAKVDYHQSPNWHYAASLLLTGYTPEERVKFIDQAVKRYKDTFNKLPKSVGAWWIDAYSLNYLKEKYQIEANLDVADQYSTDQYQVWGQYWSTPFYPSKKNALMPAASKEQKLGVVTMQWATRDPFNGYGNGVFESTYSVQANDYILHDLGSDYFEKLLDIYPQTTVGLENDFSWDKFGQEYSRQLEVIKKKAEEGKLQVKNMAEFAEYYQKLYPDVSPEVVIFANDPLGGSGKVLWYQTHEYRVGWFYNQEGSVIRDLRTYNDSGEETCYFKACEQLLLAFSANSGIDDSNFNSKWILDEGSISNVSVKKVGEALELSYKNQAGADRKIRFLKHDIEVNGKVDTIPGAILKATSSESNSKPDNSNFNSQFDFNALAPLFINFIKFLILVVIFFLLPGFTLVRNIYIAIPLGFSIFTLASYLFGYLDKLLKLPFNIDLLLWAIPIVSLAIIFKTGLPKFRKAEITKQRLILTSLILIGSFSWMLTNIKNGILFNYGYGFWGPNGHDGIWHLSLISELQKNVPPNNPVFAGESLNNYHYFFDLLVAKSANILSISNLDLLFRFFPLLISLLSGILVYKITSIIYSKYYQKGNFWASFFAVFFLYFGGSFGWIVTFFRDRSLGGETMFWAQQSISTLLNPPFAISVPIFLAGLILFYQLLSQSDKFKTLIIPLTLLWGVLIEFKAYGGILVIGALTLFCLDRIVFKRDFKIIGVLAPIGILSALVFLPANYGSESLVEYSPLWLVNSMIVSLDRLNWQRLYLTLSSGVPYKIFLGFGFGILIFIVGNLGTRIISLVAFKQIIKERFLFYFIILSFVLPLLFIQKGTSWNIVQFLYYGILVLNIFAGISMGIISLKLNKIAFLIIGALIMLLTIPTTIGTFNHYLPSRPPAKLSPGEIEGLTYLKNQPEGIVLNLPYDSKIKQKFSEPVPLFAYASTSYVSAFSSKETFLEDTINLDILDIDYKARLNLTRDFMRIKDQAQKILKENNISYVYAPKSLNFEVDETKMGLKKIFENEEVKIYKVI